ncbi:exosortase E/protease, VPEID-CTERM system [Citreimonas salinaria]|uniref:CAAX prenyl protease 2/Lysostaphin resistance protein A-like domain-containing protein n=1 Tax=Citreimonas salinaria TaxID=321339 RepID=A0A1H3MTR1_9RHOB|nr:exosortase E/protease, VPEID-CTERM system [Citreimonas salinaria]SDY79828.1 hypothetical protein SAMN05444340_11866 [Citreimonas salinaria]
MNTDLTTNQGATGVARLTVVCAILALEAAAIVIASQVLLDFDCRQVALYGACRALRLSLVQALCLAAGVVLYLTARASARVNLIRIARPRAEAAIWSGLHVLGVVCLFLPLAILPAPAFAERFAALLPVVAAGATLAVFGALFWLAPPAPLWRWLRAQGWVLPVLIGIAVLLPPLADRAARLWEWSPLAESTFAAVAWTLSFATDDLTVRPEEAIIGARGFLVAVASQCSGIEGLALTAAFLALYAVLFRDTLRQARFWSVVFPLALATSWAFNVLRIAALILIGAAGSPDLALNGFHSFAGWLSFTALVLIVLSIAHNLRWLQRDAAPRSAAIGPPDAAERILPFAVFMIASVAVNATFIDPAAGYPVIAAALVGALWVARAALVRIEWRLDAVALAAGLAVGLCWVVTAPPPAADPWAGALGPVALALWIVIRMAATVALVPVVEEMFFRGYVQERIDDGRLFRRVLAVAASVAPFAALHDRWAVAAAAGLVFAFVYMRQRRLADAITAHAVANAVVAGVAWARGDWGLI